MRRTADTKTDHFFVFDLFKIIRRFTMDLSANMSTFLLSMGEPHQKL